MITCKFSGGLGNNIYQLANLYNLHVKYGVDYSIPSTVNRGDIHLYNQSTELEFKTLFENDFNYSDDLSSFGVYNHTDTKGKFEYVPVPFRDNTCYQGYYQSDKYFTDCDIKDVLRLNVEIRDNLALRYEELFKKETIAVHYRLAGDRVKSGMQDYHKDVSPEFYKKAIDIIIGDNNKEGYNILLFSDNIDSAEVLLKDIGYDITPIRNKDNIEDFIMMSICHHNILGNSTFSWWSAYLNMMGGKVVAPKTEWFGPGYDNYNLDDLFPKNWITL